MRAYLHDNSDSDRREAHDSGAAVSVDQLRELGLLYQKLGGTAAERLTAVDALCEARKYKNRDEISLSPSLLPNYEERMSTFFTEHMHEDEEIRYVVEGSGLFDVRDKEDRWVRVVVEEGDLLIMPAGIYHRFCLDKSGCMKAVRLFKDLPRWEAIYRPEADTNGCRQAYLRSISVAA